MSAWKIYYDHWAREINKCRQNEFRLRCTSKTMKSIWKWFFVAGQAPSFGDCVSDLTTSLAETLSSILEQSPNKIQDQMGLLREISEVLTPLHTPDDKTLFDSDLSMFEIQDDSFVRSEFTPAFCLSPAEVRLNKNLGFFYDIKLMELELSSYEIRSIDAIIGLF